MINLLPALTLCDLLRQLRKSRLLRTARRDKVWSGRGSMLTAVAASCEQLERRRLMAAASASYNYEQIDLAGGGTGLGVNFSPHNSDVISVGTDMGMKFWSTDFGDHFTPVDHRQLRAGPGSELQFTDDPNLVYELHYGAYAGGSALPVRSTDGGKSFVRMPGWKPGDPSTPGDGWGVFAAPGSGTRVLVHDYNVLYFSGDRGDTFSAAYAPGAEAPNGLFVAGVAWDGDTVWVGTNVGLLVSRNGGRTFARSSAGGIAPGQSIYSMGGARGADGRWRLFAVTFESQYVYPGVRLEAVPTSRKDPGNPHPRGVYRIEPEREGNWTNLTAQLPADVYPRLVATATNDSNVVYVAAERLIDQPSVLKSTNGGGSFAETFNWQNNSNIQSGWAGVGNPEYNYYWGGAPLSIAVAPTDPNRVAITDLGFGYVTKTGGNEWQAIYVRPSDRNAAGTPVPAGKAYGGNGFVSSSVVNILESGGILFAGVADTTARVSYDGGETWVLPRFDLPQPQRNTAYDFVRGGDGRVYAGFGSVHDLGQAHRIADSIIDPGVGSIARWDNGAFRTLLQLPGPVTDLAIAPVNPADPAGPTRMYATVVDSAQGGVYVVDGYETANPRYSRLPSPTRTLADGRTVQANGHAGSVQVLKDGTLLVTYFARLDSTGRLTEDAGVWRSPDGSRWLDITPPQGRVWSRDVHVDPTDPTQNTFWLATRSGWGGVGTGAGGFLRTINGGGNWSKEFDSLGGESVAVNAATREVWFSTETEGLRIADLDDVRGTLKDTGYAFFHPLRVVPARNPADPHEVYVLSHGNGITVARTQAQPGAPAVLGVVFESNPRYDGIKYGFSSDVGRAMEANLRDVAGDRFAGFLEIYNLDSGARLPDLRLDSYNAANEAIFIPTQLPYAKFAPGRYRATLRAWAVADGDGRRMAEDHTYEFRVPGAVPAPVVQSAVVNGGAAQRSRVTGLTVAFDQVVVPGAGAFAVAGRNGAGSGVTASWSNPSGDGRTWAVSFAGPGVVAGSLPDGVYDLTVVGSKVRGGTAAGPAMAADNMVTFHRLFGDTNNSKSVNNADYLLFRNAFGKPSADPAYNPAFDADGSGTVNNADYLQFRSRFGTAFAY